MYDILQKGNNNNSTNNAKNMNFAFLLKDFKDFYSQVSNLMCL